MSSDLSRAKDTADAIAKESKGKTYVVQLDKRLREYRLGAMERLPVGTGRAMAREIKARKAGVPLESFVEDPPPERSHDMQERVLAFLGDVGAHFSSLPAGSGERRALVVSHGGCIHSLLNLSASSGMRHSVDNCSISTVTLEATADKSNEGAFRLSDGSFARLVTHQLNDTAHLAGDGEDGRGPQNSHDAKADYGDLFASLHA